MKRSHFDWDQYFAAAKYTVIASSSPDLSLRRFPTTYNADRSLIYLSSQDSDVATDSVEALQSFLPSIALSYKTAKEHRILRTMWLAQLDYFEVCGLLQSLVETPEEYDDPDDHLDAQLRVM